MPYNKVCPICTTTFFCLKVSTVFCSKKCRNRARSLPEEMRLSLIKRSNSYVMKANHHVAKVPDVNGNETAIGYIPEKLSNDNPLGLDEGLLLADAKMRMQRIKDEQERQRLTSLKSETGFGVVVDEITSNSNLEPTQDITANTSTTKKFKIKPIQRNGEEK